MPLAWRHLLGVNGDNDALRTNLAGSVENEVRILYGCRIHRHLVGPGVEQATHILDLAHATTDSQRNEDLLGTGFDDVQNDVALVRRRRDIEEGDFVCALLVVAACDLDRVAGIAQPNEIGTLDDTASRDVKTGNDALGEHQAPSSSASFWAAAKSSEPS